MASDQTTRYRSKNRHFSIPEAEVQVVGAELERIRADGDQQDYTRRIAEAAASKKSPLHKYVYAVTDKDAVVRFRLSEARRLAQEIEIEILETTPEGETRVVNIVPHAIGLREVVTGEDEEPRVVDVTVSGIDALDDEDQRKQAERVAVERIVQLMPRFAPYASDETRFLVKALERAKRWLDSGPMQVKLAPIGDLPPTAGEKRRARRAAAAAAKKKKD